MKQNKNFSLAGFLLKALQGAFVGLGAVLPGISGGVLCVIFGIYKTIMEFLADPIKKFKTHVPKLLPYGVGLIIGFLGIANLLSFLLDKYPSQSICVFIGLIGGMLPSLFREAGEKGRGTFSYISLVSAMALIFALLIGLQLLSVEITPNFFWYFFCGMCLALSVIAPGLSFSTLLMPLGLYEPFVSGIGHIDFGVLIPAGIGALATVILFAKAVNMLFERHYSVSFHAICGIVIAATVMIVPFESFASPVTAAVNLICLAFGAAAALALDKFNSKFADKK
jgi:putative membrane protein